MYMVYLDIKKSLLLDIIKINIMLVICFISYFIVKLLVWEDLMIKILFYLYIIFL